MKDFEKHINRTLMIGWLIVVFVLLIAYFGEFLKGERSSEYVLVFSAITALPALCCFVIYSKNPENSRLRYYIICGYYLMYIFVLITGSTTMVFTYIFPLLTLIVHYHQPKLVLCMGAVSVAANLVYDWQLYVTGKLNLGNSKDVEIQIVMIILCFGFLYAASQLYDNIYRKNEAYIKEIEAKETEIKEVVPHVMTAIANLIDSKDEYGKGHSLRVSAYSGAIAKALGYSDDKVRNVRCVALLHDIGKIGIPEAIINKNGKLTNDEFQAMKQHVFIGGNILQDTDIVCDLEKGARYHHERYDGTGYGEGLKGEGIPVIARIIAVADAYDAMTSNRSYRGKFSTEEVIAEIERCSGTQFDPHIADVFVTLLKENKIKQPTAEDYAQPANFSEKAIQLFNNVLEIRERQEHKEKRNSGLDYLTGTYTRDVGVSKIKELLRETSGAAAIVKILNLKDINHDYGLISGDYLIKTISDTVSGYSKKLIVCRYEGDELLCFMPSSGKDAEDFVGRLYKSIMDRLGGQPEYEDAMICIGAALSEDSGNNYGQMISAAEKALYFKKQSGQVGWHIFKNIHSTSKSAYGPDLNVLIESITNESDSDTYPEIAEMARNIRLIEQDESCKSAYIVMLTICEEYKNVRVSNRDEAMDSIESAVRSVVRSEDATIRLSSAQYVIFLRDVSEEVVESIINRILISFYKMYIRKNITVNYETSKFKG